MRSGAWAGLMVLVAGVWLAATPVMAAQGLKPAGRIIIDLTSPRPVNSFVPADTFGGAIDGMQDGEVLKRLTPYNIGKMRQAGLARVSYRTRPELGIEAWHWSEEGSWSDPAHNQGYWVSSDHPSKPIDVSWGYSLPRRGNTSDQANDEGYSRLDDGDPESFWKSNPYLDRRFTGAPENRPQWILVEFDQPTPVDAVRIQWGTPWAVAYKVQAWSGADDYDHAGRWLDFDQGARTVEGRPDDKVVRLAGQPIASRRFRILLLRSSETAPEGATDVRDRLGYAVRELQLGVVGRDGAFRDAIRHGPAKSAQTLIRVSSTDPWHRATDKDLKTEQPGLDLVFRRRLSDHPIMIPVGALYDTPENAAAEIRFLKARAYPVRQVELGEEPDGQYASPEDYADLFLETAKAVKAVDPTLQLGGPSMQGAMAPAWPTPEEGWSWTARFMARLKARGGEKELSFFSFEYYPFADLCGRMDEKLRQNASYMDRVLGQLRDGGVPASTPLVISEYGLSWSSGGAMSKLDGALFDMDTVGQFLTAGGKGLYMFGYTTSEPANQKHECSLWGDMMLWDSGPDGQARFPMPAYFAHQLMTHNWATLAEAPHALYRAESDLADDQGRPWITAYPLRRPDGSWGVMIVNRDSGEGHQVRLVFRKGGAELGFKGVVQVSQYSTRNYEYRDQGPQSRPIRDLPPTRFKAMGAGVLNLPKSSLTFVEGWGPAP